MLLKFEKVNRWDTLLARQKEQIGKWTMIVNSYLEYITDDKNMKTMKERLRGMRYLFIQTNTHLI